jgi:hypothetical protein
LPSAPGAAEDSLFRATQEFNAEMSSVFGGAPADGAAEGGPGGSLQDSYAMNRSLVQQQQRDHLSAHPPPPSPPPPPPPPAVQVHHEVVGLAGAPPGGAALPAIHIHVPPGQQGTLRIDLSIRFR